jgi:hypothetical protein
VKVFLLCALSQPLRDAQSLRAGEARHPARSGLSVN